MVVAKEGSWEKPYFLKVDTMNWFAGLLGQLTANDRFRMEVPELADMEQHPYGWLSLLPPVVAILLAILTRRVIISLLLAVFVGAMILGYYSAPQAANYEPTGWDLIQAGAVSTWYDHLWPTLLNADKVSVFVFTCLMGAVVGMVNRAAGMRGLIGLMSPITNSRVGVQVSTWFSGMFIFFDDYANTMLLGTTYRSVYDRLRVSREKLAYIVDSTAAPVAGLAIVSTWIAGELDFIKQGLSGLQLDNTHGTTTPFGLFITSIPYRFYVIWALFFVLVTAVMRRDFGPMLKAERRALAKEQHGPVEEFSLPSDLDWKRMPVSNDVIPVEMTEVVAVAHDPTLAPLKTPARSINAILPILVTVVAILGLMYQTGLNNQPKESAVIRAADPLVEAPIDTSFSATIQRWGETFGNSDSYSSLVWGSVVGALFTWFWLSWQRIVPSVSLMQAAGRGAANMIPALAILWLASTLSIMTSSNPSEPYKQELDKAQSIAKTIAGISEMDETFPTLEQIEQIAVTLRLHQVPESVIVETLAGHYRDPNQFWDQVLQHIGDKSLGSGFYGRYLMKDGQQVDWGQFQKSLKEAKPWPVNGATSSDNASLIEKTMSLHGITESQQQTPSAASKSNDVAAANAQAQDAPKEEPKDEPKDAPKDVPKENRNEESKGTEERIDGSIDSKDTEHPIEVALWPTSVRRRNQDPEKSVASKEPRPSRGRFGARAPQDGGESKSSETAESQDGPGGAGPGGGRSRPGGGGGGGGGPGGGGGGPGGGMEARFANSRAEPDLSKVFESVEGGLSFPYTDVRHRLHTGRYLTSIVLRWVGPADANANPSDPHPFAKWLPTLIFVLAGFTAFATGTSWGTMGIIMPLAIPLAGSMLSLSGPVDPNSPIFLATIAGVLAGAIFGDHCSPISDTTVLSSSASGCDHLAHVWTQLPYALAVFAVSIVCGTIPVGFEWPWWICLPVGTVALVGIMYVFGQRVENDTPGSSEGSVKANP
ncbi:MAG: Na+/H+ antiporter NhaC family protein [Pirellulaceae bacterium]|nr:Na+/H+ antiporter NhaC family protein [Pirellulaceae bacterium]